MKEFLFFLPVTIVYLAVKSTLLPNIPLPDLPLLIVFYLAYRKPSVEGVFFAFALGYLDDAFNGGIIGTTSFSLVFIYVAIHLLAKRVQFITPAFKAGGAGAASLAKGIVTYQILKSAGYAVSFLGLVVLESLVTAALAPGIISLFTRVSGALTPQSFKDNLN